MFIELKQDKRLINLDALVDIINDQETGFAYFWFHNGVSYRSSEPYQTIVNHLAVAGQLVK